MGHLMYIDDCLLVARASVEEAGVVYDVLKDYCCMSGQNVNFDKSQVIYGADVSIRYRRIIKRVLKMEEVRYPFKYLGGFSWHEVASSLCFQSSFGEDPR